MKKSQIEQLTQWYREYGPELLLFARQLTTEQAAEDAVQEAFVQLLRQSQPPGNVRAWLYRVVRNTARTLFRRLRHQTVRKRMARSPENSWFDPCPDDMMEESQDV